MENQSGGSSDTCWKLAGQPWSTVWVIWDTDRKNTLYVHQNSFSEMYLFGKADEILIFSNKSHENNQTSDELVSAFNTVQI